ncbi:MAG: ABC transporter transmembrane domain-containing protein [Brachybacterium sp.]|uniref:ABC transporter transmembrane domain-containing protein n=1 Tax=Brachybacterium sp. TaxID=1891286 RepID=UPI003F90282A
MSTNATPDVPLRNARDTEQTAAEPAWIEIGSPKRRTAPPTWSDELARDAWDAPGAADETVHAAAPGRFELLKPAAPADDPAGADVDANTSAAEATPHSPTSPSLRGVRLRRAPRATARPFRRPAARDSAGERSPHLAVEEVSRPAAEDAIPADLWVQDPAGEPTPSTHEIPVLPPGPGPESRGEPVAVSPEDPESAERWQVIRDAAAPEPEPEPEPEFEFVPEPESDTEPMPEPEPESDTEPMPEPEPEPAPVRVSEPIAEPEPVAGPESLPEPEPVREPAGQSPSLVETQAPPRPTLTLDPAPTADPASTADPAPTADPASTTDPAPTADQARRAGTLGAALDLVLPDLQAHRSTLIVGLGALVLSIWTLVALPFPLKYSIDAALAAAGAGSTAPTGIGGDPVTALLLAAGALAALVALQAGFRALAVGALHRIGGHVATALRGRLLGHVHLLGPGRDGEGLGRTGSLLTEDVARLRDLVAHTGPRLAAGLLALASLTVMMLVVEPIAAAIVLVTAGLYALVARIAQSAQRRKETAAEADGARLAETAHELLASTRTIQSYGLEQRAQRSLAELGGRSARSHAVARRSSAVGDFLGELIAGLGVGAALLLGGWRMNAGTMTPGELTMVIAAVLIAVVLAREIVHHSTGLRAIAAAGDRIWALLEHRAVISEPARPQALGALRGEVVYSALSTAGPRGPLFENISLIIPAGQHVALVGRDGTEASALLSYLLRLDQPDSGRVLLDRYDTRTLALADLRSALSVVQRGSALFSETVRENIRVGRPDATDDEVVEAARRSGADEFITLLPEGYDTLLARRGAALTDGQRRRIAITRALLRDATVVLLDGADAELDPADHESVHRALDSLTAGRTALVSSDQPQSVLDADRVLCFESGVLAEDGAPGQLAEDPDSWLAAWMRATGDTSR